MGLFGDVVGGLTGGIAGLFGDDGSGDANAFYKKLSDKYAGLNPTMRAEQATSDPAVRNAQMDALRNYQTIYSKGGLDAAGRGRISEAETEANRNAGAVENSVEQRARASGAGRSGVTAALEAQAGQGAATRGAQATRDAAAIGEGNRNAALAGATTAAGGMRSADDAVSRFNAMMRYGAQTDTFQNQMQQLGGEGSAYGAAYGAKQNEDARTRRNWTSIGTAAGGLADMGKGIYKAGGLDNYLNA